VSDVVQWLEQEGVPDAGIERRLDTLRVTCAASVAEKVLGAQLARVAHAASGGGGVRAMGALSAPAHVAAGVDFIAGLTEFFDASAAKMGSPSRPHAPDAAMAADAAAFGSAPAYPRIDVQLRVPGGGARSVLSYAPEQAAPAPAALSRSQRRRGSSGFGGFGAESDALAKDVPITPAGVRALYGVPRDATASAGLAIQGVAAFDDIFEPASLCAHEGVFGAPAVNVTFVGSLDNVDKIESDLDVQYIAALAPGATTVFRNQPAGFWVLQFAEEAVNNLEGGNGDGLEPSPHAWSVSYGWPEVWQCGNHTLGGRDNAHNNCKALGYDSAQYVARANAYFAMLGAAGVSVLVSSGDTGAPGFAYNCPVDGDDTHTPWGATAGLCRDMGAGGADCGCMGSGLRVSRGGASCTLGSRLGLYDQGECAILFEPSCASLLQAHSNVSVTDAGLLRVFAYNGPTAAPNGCALNFLPYPFEWPEAGGWQLSSTLTPVTDCACDAFPPLVSADGSCVLSAVDPATSASRDAWTHGAVDSPFYPMFPSSSPWVTSVGATQLPPASHPSGGCDAPIGAGDAASEVAASVRAGAGVTSGGGFSLFSAQPGYQADAVAGYLQASADTLPPRGTFNERGRGYPDVALNGHKYVIFEGNGVTEVDGTSASAPAFAALVTLLNDELLAAGATPLGFLNPLLYYLAATTRDVFNDVAEGDNRCTETYCCRFGFDAAQGWDPVTGLGTVNFSALRAAVLALKGVAAAPSPGAGAGAGAATA
jgi:hypothetical protein